MKINNKCSESFFLTRGTRQGCPLSSLLFALAMEPLAITIRSSARIQGFQRASGVEKIALYANDVLLFLGDTRGSLAEAMDIIIDFGQISCLNINWDKSKLLRLAEDRPVTRASASGNSQQAQILRNIHNVKPQRIHKKQYCPTF